MPSFLFWIFAVITLAGGAAVVVFRNPVSSALSMVASFVGLAALFIGLNAYFVGIIQILVYTGAVMVLFLFIIMLLDLKTEERQPMKLPYVAAGVALILAFGIQLVGVLSSRTDTPAPPLDKPALAAAAQGFEPSSRIASSLREGRLPDTHLIGRSIFTEYNLPLQILGVLLLVATVGVVVLSKKSPGSD